MQSRYIHRSLEAIVKRAAREFPALVLTGPRQSGKTTLLRRLFDPTHGYASLEPPDVRAAAVADPRGFLDLNPPPVILDEIQYAPDLLPYIKERIDQNRSGRGQYLLTGSQNLLLMERVSESLAGRTGTLRLLPLSQAEASGSASARMPWEISGPKQKQRRMHPSSTQMWLNLIRGSYPELVKEPNRDLGLWHASYMQTYLERDVRTLRHVGDLTLFQNFLRALAARSAQLLNLADLARDLGVAVNTTKAWLSVLEATHQVIVLRPYFANIGKRLVKTPKIYFTDTGTLCYLVGLKNPEHAASGPMGGAIFETAVVSELVKRLWHRGEEPRIYFWRTSAGTEVDILLEMGDKLLPIEVKASATPRPSMASSIVTFKRDFAGKAATGYVIHTGDTVLPLAPDVVSLPFAHL